MISDSPNQFVKITWTSQIMYFLLACQPKTVSNKAGKDCMRVIEVSILTVHEGILQLGVVTNSSDCLILDSIGTGNGQEASTLKMLILVYQLVAGLLAIGVQGFYYPLTANYEDDGKFDTTEATLIQLSTTSSLNLKQNHFSSLCV